MSPRVVRLVGDTHRINFGDLPLPAYHYAALMILAFAPAYPSQASSPAALAQAEALPLKYTALFGGDALISSVAADGNGNAYIAGTALAPLPVTAGAFQSEYKPGTCVSYIPNTTPQTHPCPVAFAGKLNHDGTALVYLTYLGASNSSASRIALDGEGNAWITGTVLSADLPVTAGALQPQLKGAQNAFILKLNATGSRVLFGTYLGGSNSTTAGALTVDVKGNAYVAGTTSSMEFFTTPGAFQTGAGQQLTGQNASFVTKFDVNGKLVYSTYFHGGNGSGTYVSSIAADATGNAYLTGSHRGGSLPTTPEALQPSANPWDSAFAAKLDTTGSKLLYSTYLGANSQVSGNRIAVDGQGNAYVSGDIRPNTEQPSSFPTTPGAFQTTIPQFAIQSAPFIGFITKLNASGSALIYSTFLYASDSTDVRDFVVDSTGSVVAVGTTYALDFPTTPGALRQCNPNGTWGSTGFLLKLAPDGSRPLYSTYLGTSALSAVALDSAGDVYIAGAYLGTLPVAPGSFGWTGSGNFVVRLAPAPVADGSVSCVVSAASQGGRAIAPGEIVDIWGNNIGPAQNLSASVSAGHIDTALGGVQVLFNSIPAPLLAVGPHRIRAVVPFETGPTNLAASGSATIQILNGSTTMQPFTAPTAALAPSIFTVAGGPAGQALMINEDGTLNSKQTPARQGSIVTIYATGLNNTQPALETGMIAVAAAPLALQAQSASDGGIQIGSASFGQAEILYAGAAPGFVAGLTQINLRIPVSIFHGFSGLYIQHPKSASFSSQNGVYFYMQ